MRTLVLILAAVVLSACATGQRLDAARDVHSLLTAIRDDDGASFEAHIDRPALQREIESRMMQELARSNADPAAKFMGALLGPSVSRAAGDLLIQPATFRYVASTYGYKPSQPIPGPMYIAQALRPLGDGRVCAVAKAEGPCLLIFSHRPGDTWRLSGFEGDLKMLKRPF